MNYILLCVVVVGVYIQNIFQKQYSLKIGGKKDSDLLYLFFMAIAMMVFLGIIFVFTRDFNIRSLPYALVFSVSFSVATLFQLLAIKVGSLSLTSLAISFSLIMPTLFGIIFYSERLSVLGYVGLGLLCVSLALINCVGKNNKFNLKWLIYVSLAFIGNGLCCIIQKVHQTEQGGRYSVCFQFFAMVGVLFVISFIMAVKRPKDGLVVLKKSGVYPICSGIANAVVNIGMLYLAVKMPAAILYPSVSAGGIALTFITALLLYKEKLKLTQYLGYVFGMVAIVLLNI